MSHRYMPTAINYQDLECYSTRGRRRCDRSCLVTSSALAALPILLFFLWINTSHQDGYLRFFSVADIANEFHHRNSTRGTSLRGNPVIPNYTWISEHRMFPPQFSNAVSKVPFLQDSKEYIGATKHNIQNTLNDGSVKNGPRRLNGWTELTKSHRIKWRRYRRAAGESTPHTTTVPPQYSQPMPTPTKLGGSPEYSFQFTTMPETSSTAVQYEFNSKYAITTDHPTSTPTADLSTNGDLELKSPSSQTLQPTTLPGSQSSNADPVSYRPTPLLQTSRPYPPSPSTATVHDVVSTPIPSEFPLDSARSDAYSPEPTEHASVTGATRTSQTMTSSTQDPAGDGTRENLRMTQRLSASSFKPVSFTSTTVTTGNPFKTSSNLSPSGPQNVNVERIQAKQQNGDVYTVVTRIKTSPSILTIMPCLVGLALLGLLGTGIKRYVLYRRLGRMAELSRDPEMGKEDKGYTIENPMVKSRRSYIERQMERTLQKVNKTESSRSSSSRNSSTGKNNNTFTKVRMEVAAISDGSLRSSFMSLRRADGSLRMPVQPLRRAASERVAPSRTKPNNAGFLWSHRRSETGCQCICHCPLCGKEGRPLGNGDVETSTRL